jgi:hypothetical protein
MNISEDTIGIYIMSSHENYLSNLIKILQSHSGDVIIFSSEEYLKRVAKETFDNDSFSWVAKSESEPLQSFLSRASDIWNSRVDTLISFPFYHRFPDLFHYYKLDFDCTHLQMVYNVNLWMASNLRLTPKVYLYLESILRKRILSNVDGILVEYSPIKKYLRNTSIECDIDVFAPIIYNGFTKCNSRPQVTIPGHIEPDRRDYSFFFHSLQYLEDIQDEFEIHLLGSPNGSGGKRVISICDQLISSGWNIQYYNDWIPVEQFEKSLKDTNVLISPINKTKKIGAVTETYGRSKGSGSFSDAIKYGKKLALPAHYEIPPEVESIVQPYSSKRDLAKIIRSSLESEGLSKPRLDQLEKIFDLESQKRRFYNILSKYH